MKWCGNPRTSGDARTCGNTKICGNARGSGCAAYAALCSLRVLGASASA